MVVSQIFDGVWDYTMQPKTAGKSSEQKLISILDANCSRGCIIWLFTDLVFYLIYKTEAYESKVKLTMERLSSLLNVLRADALRNWLIQGYAELCGRAGIWAQFFQVQG